MKSEEIEGQIGALEADRGTMACQLEALIDRAKPHLSTVSAKWMETAVERAICQDPDQVQKLGQPQLSALKGKLKDLKDATPKLVMQHMANKDAWPHNRVQDLHDYDNAKARAFFEETFRAVINHIGAVLAEFELIRESGTSHPAWQRIHSGNTYRYAINPGWDQVDCEPVKEYINLYRKYLALGSTINQKRSELAQARAKELWDSA